MSSSEPSFEELRTQLIRGEIDADTFQDELGGLGLDADKETLWARWAAQGLFDEPIDQDGFLSLRGGIPEEVDGDG